MKNLPLIRPVMPDPQDFIPYLAASYRQKQFTNYGPCVQLLEQRIQAEYAPPGRSVIMTANATCGLTAVLNSVCDIRETVLCPEFTFPATIQSIYAAGKWPEGVRCDPDTLEMDINHLEELLGHHGSNISAVVYVRAFGLCCELAEVRAVCENYQKPLIVDAAAAFGGTRLFTGFPVGHEGDAEVFSCHATKPFGIGEGGIVMIKPEHETTLRQNINFGIGDHGDIRYPAINGKMSEFHAAVGLALLDQFPAHLQRRREIADRYIDHAPYWGSDFDYSESAIGNPPWHVFPLVLHSRKATMPIADALDEAGIAYRRYYTPLFAHQHTPTSLPNRVLCLPVYSDMTDEELETILTTINQAF